MNNKNLKPANQRSKKEVREIAKKGGIKSGKIRREKRAMKELLELVLSAQTTNKKGETGQKRKSS